MLDAFCFCDVMCKEDWTRAFYNSKAWRHKRLYILMLYKYRCQCHRLFGGKPCKEVATEVHHVKDLKDYPALALDDDNLLPLSRDAHEKTKKRKRNEKTPRGVRVIKI